MTVLTDRPPRADAVVVDALASRLGRYLRRVGGDPVQVSPAVGRRFVRLDGALNAVLRRNYGWDYFIVEGRRAWMASFRQRGDALTFEKLTSGALVLTTLAAMGLLEEALAASEGIFHIRVMECQAARLVSVVAQTRSGSGYHVDVVDDVLIHRRCLRVEPSPSAWRRRLSERLPARLHDGLIDRASFADDRSTRSRARVDGAP